MIELSPVWSWGLQLLVLSAAIYLFLRLARRSRGNRVVSLLVTGGLLLVVALWGLTETLSLAELQHVLSSVTGFVVVVLAIVFQPELRRAMGQLGRPGGAFRGRRHAAEVVDQVVQAALAMGRRRRGALITFERESSLDPWCDRGVSIDARVDRSLLESIFEPSGSLHDGAVVIRDGRIVATCCVFPLSEDRELARTLGTRHRAALGLAEETDAVTVVVSEETGRTSIAANGRLERVEEDRLADGLRAALGADDAARSERSLDLVGGLWAVLRSVGRDVYWVVISLVLGAGLLYVAHGQVVQEDSFPFELVLGRAAELESESQAVRERLRPRAGRVVVVLDVPGFTFDTARTLSSHDLLVKGTRERIERFRREAAGELRIDSTDAPVALDAARIDWNTEVLGLELRWDDAPAPLGFVRVGTETFELAARHLPLVTDVLKPHVAVKGSETVFDPPRVEVSGPAAAVEALRAGESVPLFTPLPLGDDPEVGLWYELEVAEVWRQQGVRLSSRVRAQPLVSHSGHTLGPFVIDIALVCMDPDRAEELERWTLSASNTSARFEVDAIGILPVGALDDESADLRVRLNSFVRANLVAYVDVSEVSAPEEAGTARVAVRSYFRRPFEHPDTLSELELDPERLSDWSEFTQRLVSDELVELERATQGS